MPLRYCFVTFLLLLLTRPLVAGEVVLSVVDAKSNAPLGARFYLHNSAGKTVHPFVEKTSYAKHGDPYWGGNEVFIAIPTSPATLKLPAGKYKLHVEHGKEYLPHDGELEVSEQSPTKLSVPLKRLFDMAALGWYSGDTHVHTPPQDLTVMQLAEDVNVAFPITAWARTKDEAPQGINRQPVPTKGEAKSIDARHLYWTLNTEYEIGDIAGENTALGALIVLGQRAPLTNKVPPVIQMIHDAQSQGAVVDLEKHGWAWSSMVIALDGIDSFPIANNRMWRKDPPFKNWGERPPASLKLTDDSAGWMQYVFQTYYAILNTGLVLPISGGTANGMMGVPLGYSRVYVHIDGPLTFEKWFAGFKAGRSFVTNGPMLLIEADGLRPGDHKQLAAGQSLPLKLKIKAGGTRPLQQVEVVVNGVVVKQIDATKQAADATGFQVWEVPVTIQGSSWLAVRCMEQPVEEIVQFAHTAPIYFDDPTRLLRPRKDQVDLLKSGLEGPMKRLEGKLSKQAWGEFEAARVRLNGMLTSD
ncbi:MAG: CehA/McbA family metallohydrolase [Planctomycetota bacterium]|nr:CehA/McbA family metallohydrolase [Planctomycetota bacterium]